MANRIANAFWFQGMIKEIIYVHMAMALWLSFVFFLLFFHLFVNVYVGACAFIFYSLRTTLFKDISMLFYSFLPTLFFILSNSSGSNKYVCFGPINWYAVRSRNVVVIFNFGLLCARENPFSCRILCGLTTLIIMMSKASISRIKNTISLQFFGLFFA